MTIALIAFLIGYPIGLAINHNQHKPAAVEKAAEPAKPQQPQIDQVTKK